MSDRTLVFLGMALVVMGSYFSAYTIGVNDASYRAMTQSPVEASVKGAITMLLLSLGIVLLVNRERSPRDITRRAAMKTLFAAISIAAAFSLIGHMVGVQEGQMFSAMGREVHRSFVQYGFGLIALAGAVLLRIRERRTFLI